MKNFLLPQTLYVMSDTHSHLSLYEDLAYPLGLGWLSHYYGSIDQCEKCFMKSPLNSQSVVIISTSPNEGSSLSVNQGSIWTTTVDLPYYYENGYLSRDTKFVVDKMAGYTLSCLDVSGAEFAISIPYFFLGCESLTG